MKSRTLAVVSAAQFLIALDYSIIQVALPRIAADLRLAPALTGWIISAYAVMFAGLLVVGGRLADRVGARRMFVGAVLGFGAASALGAVATGPTALLAARGGQGVAAALLQPAVLALIGAAFPAGPARARAVAVWGSVGASGLAAGVILGGALTALSWRLTFLVNVPVTVACALAARGLTVRPAPAARMPLRAASAATGAVLALLTGLTLAAGPGWTAAPTLLALAVAGTLAAIFVTGERSATAHGDHPTPPLGGQPGSPSTSRFRRPASAPLVPGALRRSRSLRAGTVAAALYMASVGAEFFLLTLVLQDVAGYPPLRTGVAFLPLAASVTVGSTLAGRLLRGMPAPTVLAGGFALSAAGLTWLAVGVGSIAAGGYLVGLVPGLVASGVGHGMVYTSTFTLGTRDAPPAHQGTAGALITTAQYVAGAVAVALLTLLLGPAPDGGDFRLAFGATALAALAGALIGLRDVDAADAHGPNRPQPADGQPAAHREPAHSGDMDPAHPHGRPAPVV